MRLGGAAAPRGQVEPPLPPTPAERGRGAAEEAPDGPDSRLPQRRPGTGPPRSTTLAAENIYIPMRPSAPYFCLKPAWESVPATWEAATPGQGGSCLPGELTSLTRGQDEGARAWEGAQKGPRGSERPACWALRPLPRGPYASRGLCSRALPTGDARKAPPPGEPGRHAASLPRDCPPARLPTRETSHLLGCPLARLPSRTPK